ncbi:Nicotinate dehydrogenase subunit A [Imperialibacter sp. EC-SDR9]|uniref:(2Fe-2S)-binding protein n=2 Tax=Imperialibacter TaxID=1649461 RepID=UPI001251A93E|nr:MULTISPECIES: (2Fe-2S)-binding protein [unclassified Imperialibacter]CAD5262941.1 Nicotinate dehydrogenase subunit A [Imperialibacter sp. 75]CAD5275582.1 Nicotinate dehydrogenase subunit A [Imperialibacter sp. 89]VVT08287.1 Nicotinate dehydrogenase subunit A [Imperialibacter sp. EC-SDR9]
MPEFTLDINGAQKTVETEPDTPLLYVLRNDLAINGPKFGCGLSQCGACMVLLDGRATTSCMLSVSSIGNTEITTLEGLVDDNAKLHVVQEAFVKEQAAQCGYCLNGMVMAAVDLLNKNPRPDDAAIREALQFNLCRCGTHARVVKAVKRAAKTH